MREFTDVFRLGIDYVVAAFINRPDAYYHVALPEAALVSHFCSATNELTSDLGRRFATAFRDLVR